MVEGRPEVESAWETDRAQLAGWRSGGAGGRASGWSVGQLGGGRFGGTFGERGERVTSGVDV
jgi:hypothetical protein